MGVRSGRARARAARAARGLACLLALPRPRLASASCRLPAHVAALQRPRRHLPSSAAKRPQGLALLICQASTGPGPPPASWPFALSHRASPLQLGSGERLHSSPPAAEPPGVPGCLAGPPGRYGAPQAAAGGCGPAQAGHTKKRNAVSAGASAEGGCNVGRLSPALAGVGPCTPLRCERGDGRGWARWRAGTRGRPRQASPRGSARGSGVPPLARSASG